MTAAMKGRMDTGLAVVGAGGMLPTIAIILLVRHSKMLFTGHCYAHASFQFCYHFKLEQHALDQVQPIQHIKFRVDAICLQCC